MGCLSLFCAAGLAPTHRPAQNKEIKKRISQLHFAAPPYSVYHHHCHHHTVSTVSTMANETDLNILGAIQALNECGFSNVNTFLQAFLGSNNPSIKQKAGVFLSRSSGEIIRLMLSHSKFAPSVRKTAAVVEDCSKELGKELMDWVIMILLAEVKKLANDPESRLSPDKASLIGNNVLLDLT